MQQQTVSSGGSFLVWRQAELVREREDHGHHSPALPERGGACFKHVLRASQTWWLPFATVLFSACRKREVHAARDQYTRDLLFRWNFFCWKNGFCGLHMVHLDPGTLGQGHTSLCVILFYHPLRSVHFSTCQRPYFMLLSKRWSLHGEKGKCCMRPVNRIHFAKFFLCTKKWSNLNALGSCTLCFHSLLCHVM